MSKIDLTAGTAASLFLGGLAAILLTLVWGGFWSGLALSTLWGWFVVPVFQLPALTIVQAYGLALVVQVAKGTSGKPEKSEGFVSAIAKACLTPPAVAMLVLLLGWVAKSWM